MKLVDKYFNDKDGKIVIFQAPNIPIYTYAVCFILSKMTDGSAQQLFSIVGFGSLFVFAWLELFDGVNYFRRTLGLALLVLLIISKIGQNAV